MKFEKQRLESKKQQESFSSTFKRKTNKLKIKNNNKIKKKLILRKKI